MMSAIRRLVHLILSLCAVLATTLPVAAEVINGIAAVVNDEVITRRDVEREAALLARAPGADGASVRDTALNRLIEKTLVRQKIRELGITVTEEEIRLAIEDVRKQNNLSPEQFSKALASQGLSPERYRQQLTEQLQRLKLMSREVRSRIQVMDSEIEEYYARNPGEFSTPEAFSARHVFFALSRSPGDDEIRKVERKARPVLEKARAGADFAALAREFSEDPGAVKDGGDLGTFRLDDMVPEIARVIVSLPEGGVSDLVRSSAGIHILKLERRIPASVRPLEEVRETIRELLYRKRSEERFSQWTEELKRGASIEIPGVTDPPPAASPPAPAAGG